ncbi:MAG: hypothetical protein FWH14_07695, partial [Oscillospiraceae bacterium]|nr:hypothetical protein [Oscillospiraceae bacterium]
GVANTRNKVAIVFDGVVCLETPSQSALPPTALPKGEPRVSTIQILWVSLPLPLGEVSRHGVTEMAVGYAPPCVPYSS